jgi:hypothetical protein
MSKPVISETTVKKIVRSVITNQLALDYHEELKHTSYYRQSFKSALNLAQKELLKSEKEYFETFLGLMESPDSVDYLYDQQFEMIKALSEIDVPDYSDIAKIIVAFKTNPKSMIGIANKINSK